jgi:hypothetical protein
MFMAVGALLLGKNVALPVLFTNNQLFGWIMILYGLWSISNLRSKGNGEKPEKKPANKKGETTSENSNRN